MSHRSQISDANKTSKSEWDIQMGEDIQIH